MQLNVMPLSELLTTANNYATSIKELGIYSDLVKELCIRLDAGSIARREITKQRDALAAENAALKAAIKDVTDSAEEVEYEGYFTFVVNPDAVHSGVDLIEGETPATDAFIAEQRAQGAEACVKALATSDDDDFTDAPNICANVAAKLRQGGAA
ncbi:hypothetical protein [Franconibacter helveticus]|uniref:hypothetical protein n=1 Tax=Franconibacter helveticus TaxID=357240 RepID=UPI000DA146FB|nr:hypothetical protein [Franconibacter helveticus]